MTEHIFGGRWTNEKLKRVRNYLHAYTTIFKGNENARRWYKITYVDAFAGTGQRKDSKSKKAADDSLFGVLQDEDAESLKEGSAQIALTVQPEFDSYLFIEKQKSKIPALRNLIEGFRGKSEKTEIRHGDANEQLTQWCEEVDWSRNRAVVFLDPYGMQVKWPLLEAIAATRAIDLWILFPIGVAVNRMLTSKGTPPAGWSRCLTRFFGTNEWFDSFYRSDDQPTLFPMEESIAKVATYDRIATFFVKRLKSIFARVAENNLLLENTQGTPIYLLCFAAGNPKKAGLAVSIADNILGK